MHDFWCSKILNPSELEEIDESLILAGKKSKLNSIYNKIILNIIILFIYYMIIEKKYFKNVIFFLLK